VINNSHGVQSSQGSSAEIYTIGILNFKLYITNDKRLTQLAAKTKTLSFAPLLRTHMKIHATISDETYRLFDGKLLEELSLCTKESLAPGPRLDAQNVRMGAQALAEVTDLLAKPEVNLLAWAKHAVVQATAAGLYGFEHPLKSPNIETALW
jgi:hypothetical protein